MIPKKASQNLYDSMSIRPRKLSRRAVLAHLAAGAGVAAGLGRFGGASAAPASMSDLWATYRTRFVEADGRVVDSFNKRISHSESQGWGMLLAAAAGDWATFDRIWAWTETQLTWAGAPLFAWSWDPKAGIVSDPNDASDGDILIAWALLRAGFARQRPDLIDRAKRTIAAIRALLIADVAGEPALLPGFYGFGDKGRTTINLSYYVFPAFWDFAHLDGDPIWTAVNDAGVALARRARFGRYGLAPDWLDIGDDGALAPAEKWPKRFSYDAIRVPLYLFWAGYDAADDLGVYRNAWRAYQPPPAWFALDDSANADIAATVGATAIAELIDGRRPSDATLWAAVKEGEYYDASLALLAALAAKDRSLR